MLVLPRRIENECGEDLGQFVSGVQPFGGAEAEEPRLLVQVPPERLQGRVRREDLVVGVLVVDPVADELVQRVVEKHRVLAVRELPQGGQGLHLLARLGHALVRSQPQLALHRTGLEELGEGIGIDAARMKDDRVGVQQRLLRPLVDVDAPEAEGLQQAPDGVRRRQGLDRGVHDRVRGDHVHTDQMVDGGVPQRAAVLEDDLRIVPTGLARPDHRLLVANIDARELPR
mmetsp:Transcript_11372/g.32766  ORF Transcript_11372/g.32766 Transcript_11372/m.32766 type:complete len:229 (-) Transcript_11372:1902-2588(-)